MKIWMLDPSAKTAHYNLHLLKALDEAGVDVRLLTSRFVHERHVPYSDEYSDYFFFQSLEKRTALLKQSALLRWGARFLVYTWDMHRFWRMCRCTPPDLLHIQWTLLPRFDRYLFKHIAKQVPILLTIHNPLPRKSLLARLDDMTPLAPLASAIIVHARENRDTLSKRLAINSAQIHVVPHGPLFETIPEADPAETRRQLGLPPHAPVVLFFGIIKPYKGLHDLIAAMEQVRRELPDVQLVVAGSPQEPIEPYREAIAHRNLTDATHLHIGFVESYNVSTFFAAANVVCLPYRQASQSGVLLSAYRFGKAVVVTDAGGLSETVEHGQNGYVVPVNDPAALSTALVDILADPAKCYEFGLYSRQLAQTRYNWQTAAKLTHTIYKQIIA